MDLCLSNLICTTFSALVSLFGDSSQSPANLHRLATLGFG
ncbi:hypothetical protein HMPREF1582_00152 [Gardnerella vaginalis JCP8151A]|nr:hypothetical protein HMPREF1582_00152 [Gardnerella vaginalis JCP8151A]